MACRSRPSWSACASCAPTGDELLVRAVEAAVALLAFVLATLEVRSLFQRGSMAAPDAGFMERAFYVLVWGAFALAALWLARTARAIRWRCGRGG